MGTVGFFKRDTQCYKNMRYMFDTNIFNEILDREIDINSFRSGITCCVTHIQRDEINKCKEENRGYDLNKIFEDIVEEKYLTETFITGVSRAGEARAGNSELYNKLVTFKSVGIWFRAAAHYGVSFGLAVL